MRRPAFQFYPADWRRDNELRVCSIAARGLWIEMMAIMHDGTPYGHLAISARPVTPAQLASLVGLATGVCKRLLMELEDHRVFSRTADGLIYSRRMVKDEQLRESRAASGKLGGNPALKDMRRDKGLDKHLVKQKPTPAVAVAVASASAPAELQQQLPSPTRKRREVGAGETRTSWLTPVATVWDAFFDPGAFAVVAKQAARELAPLRKHHSDEEIARRLKYYLTVRGDRFGDDKLPEKRSTSTWTPNLRNFAATFGVWKTTQDELPGAA